MFHGKLLGPIKTKKLNAPRLPAAIEDPLVRKFRSGRPIYFNETSHCR
jgi:hypothetical protein